MQKLNDFPVVKSFLQAVHFEYLVDNLFPETTDMDMYGTRHAVDRQWSGIGRRWYSKYPASILHKLLNWQEYNAIHTQPLGTQLRHSQFGGIVMGK